MFSNWYGVLWMFGWKLMRRGEFVWVYELKGLRKSLFVLNLDG